MADIASARCHYGKFGAVYAQQEPFFPEERQLLVAYARQAAAALDAATALEEARGRHATSGALVQLAQGLANLASPEDVAARIAAAVPGVVTAATGEGRPPLEFRDDTEARLVGLANQAAVALSNARLLAQERATLSELRRSEARVKHQAAHDALTGLANRTLFTERLQATLARGAGATVVFVDLDDFKAVNDSFGHAVGDDLLAAVSARLLACMRAGDTVARLGGDEFAVLLEGADERAAVQTAERLIDALGMPLALPGTTVNVRASVGIAVTPPGTGDVGEVLRNADVARYAAKEAGKGRFAIFEPGMHTRALDLIEQEHDEATRWQAAPELKLGVNLSARQLSDAGLIDQVATTLSSTGLAADRLVLEITETALLNSAPDRVLARLREMGVRVSLDDFGTGYSSLEHLRRVPVDSIKIDKVFIEQVTGGLRESALARAIVQLGQAMGLATVAEGIETAEQAAVLQDLGRGYGQGYFFARADDRRGAADAPGAAGRP